MKYDVGTVGRTFLARLEDGDPVYASIEELARNEGLSCAAVWIIGGVKNVGVVVGPKDPDSRPLEPVIERFSSPHEILGFGTLVCTESGTPKLHMHAGLGEGRSPLVGCPREGADCWLINEVVILELHNMRAVRAMGSTGLSLLKILS
jgi:uncharacterized protein